MATEARAMPGPFSGLSVKIIATIIFVILAVEVIIYLPSAANFRMSWLEDRLRVGIVAARVLDAVPDIMAMPRALTDRLLNSAGATAIVYRREGQSQLLELEQAPMPREAVTVDMRLRDPLTVIGGVLDTLVMGGERTLRIIGEGDPAGDGETLVEVLMPEQPLRLELLIYSRNTFVISLIVALMTAVVLYLFVSRILIAPIRRLSENMLGYRQAPENATLIIDATPRRRDEIGILEQELAAMETDIFTLLRQRRHLADLGLAVSKINHDLRNTLTSAQLLSDQVATLDDPKVQRLAPRLVHSIDKAIGFAQSVLDYGRQSTTPPRPVPVDLRALVDEAAFDAGLVGHPAVKLRNEVPDGVTLRADPEQLARVFTNLLKNAREALEAQNGGAASPAVTVRFAETAEGLVITVADNGPGLPPRALENLFVAFEGSARAGGTGLGLAIARELIEAHGGRLAYVPQESGVRFDITLPSEVLLR
jgi:signal transduction histidine kinase